MKKNYSLILFLLLLSASGFTQTFEIGGQVRPRAEYRHGYRSLIGDDIKAAFSISQRTRLNVNYSSKAFKSVISLQNVRVWGDVAVSNKSDANGTAIYQAWGELFLSEKFSLKIGRQSISYDDQRLFGTSDWSQQARSHDAVLVKYIPSKSTSFNAGFAYNQSADKDTGNFYSISSYKALQYLWAHHETEHLALSFLFVNNGLPYNTFTSENSPLQEIKYTQTFGPYITYKQGSLKVNLAAYLQTGKNAKNINKSAWFAGADAVYSISDFGLGAGFQYLTGNDQVNPDDKDHEFSTLYGTGHRFNGWMDYFYAGNSHKGVGLLDLYLPVTYKKDKLSAEFQLHYYQSAADVKTADNPTTAMSSGLGTEAGIMLTYAFTPELNITGGYSQMFGTETLQAVKGGNYKNTQNWAWVMFTFNPTFFKSEK